MDEEDGGAGASPAARPSSPGSSKAFLVLAWAMKLGLLVAALAALAYAARHPKAACGPSPAYSSAPAFGSAPPYCRKSMLLTILPSDRAAGNGCAVAP